MATVLQTEAIIIGWGIVAQGRYHIAIPLTMKTIHAATMAPFFPKVRWLAKMRSTELNMPDAVRSVT